MEKNGACSFADKLLNKAYQTDNETFVKKLFLIIIAIAGVIFSLSLIFYFCNWGVLGFYTGSIIAGDYGDFFDVLDFIQNRNPYQDALLEGGVANYPPLGYLIFYPFALLTRLGGAKISVNNPMGIVALLLFIGLTFVPVALLVYKKLPFSKKTKWIVTIGLFVSYISWFEFSRMNINILALDFVMLFFCFYNSKNSLARALSIVCIAAAGAIKLYPFFLVVILLKEKRIKDFILSGVYLVALIILPFFAFHNGITNLKYMIEQMTSFVSMDQVKYFNMNDVTVMKLMRAVCAMVGLNASDPTLIKILQIVKYLFFAVSCVALLFTKNRFKFALLATLAYINFPDNNYTYSLIFMLVPLLEFFNDAETFGTPQTKLNGETLFYLLTMWLMLTYFYDLIFVIPLLLIFILIINVKTGHHKKFSIGFIIAVTIIAVLCIVNSILYAVDGTKPLDPYMAYGMQPSRAYIPLIMQVFLIVEAFMLKFKKKATAVCDKQDVAQIDNENVQSTCEESELNVTE